MSPQTRNYRRAAAGTPIIILGDQLDNLPTFSFWSLFRLIQFLFFFFFLFSSLLGPQVPTLLDISASFKSELALGNQLLASKISAINFNHHFDALVEMQKQAIVQANHIHASALTQSQEVYDSILELQRVQAPVLAQIHNELVRENPGDFFKELVVTRVKPKVLFDVYVSGVKALHFELRDGSIYAGTLGVKKLVTTISETNYQVDHPNNRVKCFDPKSINFVILGSSVSSSGVLCLPVLYFNDVAAWLRSPPDVNSWKTYLGVDYVGGKFLSPIADFIDSLILNEDAPVISPRQACVLECPKFCVGEGNWCMEKCRKHCSGFSDKKPPSNREEYEKLQAEADRQGHIKISPVEYCDSTKQRRKRLRQSHPEWYESPEYRCTV